MARDRDYAYQWLFTPEGKVDEKPIPMEQSGDAPHQIKRKENGTMTRLGDYCRHDKSERALRLQDVANEELTVLDFRLAEGDFGEYAFIDVVREDGTEATLITGGVYVIEALKNAKADKALPIQAKFVKAGRSWIVE